MKIIELFLSALVGLVIAFVLAIAWPYIVITSGVLFFLAIVGAIMAAGRESAAVASGQASLSGWGYVPTGSGRAMKLEYFDAGQQYNQDSRAEQEFYNQ